MRIALVTPEFPPDSIGGGGVVFEALAYEYLKSHEVQVFTAADSTRSWVRGRLHDPPTTLTLNRYPLIPLGRRIPYLRTAMPPNVTAWLDMRTDLAKWKPDVAHVHGYGHAFVDVTAFTLAKRGVPYLFTVHGIPTRPQRRNVIVRVAFETYERFGVGRAIQRAEAVTAVSTAAAGSLARRRRVHIIPNGVAPLAPSNDTRREQLRRRLGISDSAPVIAAAGRLSIEKGFDVLVKALDQVRVPRLVCVIAGSDGGTAAQVAELGANVRRGARLLLPGRLSKDDVADLFGIADVVVVPSREESFGLVALEALASGKRLVATRVGGLPEFLHSGVAELVPREDAAALASAITTSLARGPLAPAELQDAQSVVASHSWSAIADRYERLLTEMTQARAGGFGI